MRVTMGVWYVAVSLALFSCGRVSLETRTFDLRYLQPSDAVPLIEPYVYGDREGAPGMTSAIDRAITVRETADNLDRIGRVLERYDAPPASVALQFQLIEANGNVEVDPRIAEVEEALRKLFRFDGYRLITETVVTTLAGRRFSQAMFEEETTDGLVAYRLQGHVGPLQGRGDSAQVELDVNLESLFGASVAVPLAHTVVIGTVRLNTSRAIILTVRADRSEGP